MKYNLKIFAEKGFLALFVISDKTLQGFPPTLNVKSQSNIFTTCPWFPVVHCWRLLAVCRQIVKVYSQFMTRRQNPIFFISPAGSSRPEPGQQELGHGTQTQE